MNIALLTAGGVGNRMGQDIPKDPQRLKAEYSDDFL